MALRESWLETWKSKIVSAEEALKHVKSGDTIFIGGGAATPHTLIEALVARADSLSDVDIYHLLTLGDAPYVDPKYKNNFRLNTLFISSNVRKAVQEGRADYTPIFLSEIPNEFATGRIGLDVALVQTSPPDENGFMTYGVSVDIVKSAVENAGLVICEVNDQMPRTYGDTLVHVNEVDWLVPTSRPLPEYILPEPDETIRKIAKYVADLVEDGATVEFGIGRIPQAVAEFLVDKRDLGIHTEMFTDSLMDLIKKGVVTCSQKTLNRGKVVASLCMGSQELYDFVNNNSFIEFFPSEYVNNPAIIAQHRNMVAINVGLEVDLTGQVCADSIGAKFYSGFGGQVDFVRGAARAEGGKAIIALPSTAQDGKVSRIVPTLSQGAGVTITRGDVHYIVTEYGVAYLHGKSVQERALALISIAHPKFRNELLQEAKRLHFVREEQQQLHIGEGEYPEELVHHATLIDGTEVLFRPIKPTDDKPLRDMLYSLSPESIYYRFFQPLKRFSFDYRQQMVNVNPKEQLAIVGCIPSPEGEQIIAVACYIHEPGSDLAEVAFLVHDEWQKKGIGTHLLHFLAGVARKNGLKGFRATVLKDNHAMLHVFYSSGYEIQAKLEDDVYLVRFYFDTKKEKGRAR